MKYQSSYYYSVQLFNWHKKALTGNVERRNVTIMFLDKTTDSRMDIILVNAWPISYEGPDLFAQDSETTYETLTLVYEGIELVHQ
jgi:phage tail-like protein